MRNDVRVCVIFHPAGGRFKAYLGDIFSMGTKGQAESDGGTGPAYEVYEKRPKFNGG